MHAILGALLGGGKGFAIGAVVGAGVVAGVQATTKGTQVRLPAESLPKALIRWPQKASTKSRVNPTARMTCFAAFSQNRRLLRAC